MMHKHFRLLLSVLIGRGARSRAIRVTSLAVLTFGTFACSSDDSSPSEQNDPSTPEGWANLTVAERCALAEDNLQEACGDPPPDATSRQALINACVSDYRRETSIGCGTEWDTYEACLAAHGPLDCDTDEPCTRELDAAFVCRSDFTSSTGCTPNDRTAECAAETPIPLYCRGALPAGCVQNASGDPVALTCCPVFD